MSRPRIVQTDQQIGFQWVDELGEPIGLPALMAIADEPERLVPTHLEALDDALIDAVGRFGELLGGGRAPAPGQERADMQELHRVLDRLTREYADALSLTQLPVEIRGGQIIGTSALIAIRARMALGTAGPFPLAGELDDPRLGVVAGRGQLQAADPTRPWCGARWVVQSEEGPRYPLTLSMLLFDSSGVNKDAALDEHRVALTTLTRMAEALLSKPSSEPGVVVDVDVLAGAIDWLLFDWLMAHRESPDSAAIELRKDRPDDAVMIVASAAAAARLRPVAVARQRITVRGVVQGVGFRPFVYAQARAIGLSGRVINDAGGVLIEIEGPVGALEAFADRLRTTAPALARVDEITIEPVPRQGGTDFVIEASIGGVGRTLVSPDVATCDDCLAELSDPHDRRYRHAFISCTNCGPRFTIVTGLPYDRPATTMAELPLCADCAAEYGDPADRRFHAQTVACPQCGPTLTLRRPAESDVVGPAAIEEARALLRAGGVIAVKGLGGYHLACDATNAAAVGALRKRKDRGDKPFAVMVPDLATALQLAHISDVERQVLTDRRRPVVLLQTRPGGLTLAPEVAPGTRDVGILMAYTPVHHLLFGLPGDVARPQVLVMTSGNLSGEPIVTADADALQRLSSLADAWLMHDRPIHVPCDDSVVRVVDGAELPVRRSRGFAPLPIALPLAVRPALAVGGDLKNTFCLGDGGYAWLSAHVGDMDDLATQRALETAVVQLETVTAVRPEIVVADRHPAYRSSAWADRNPARLPVHRVQHHHAHIASAMAENGADGVERVIGVAFDGTGYGDDGAVWGGEVLLADYDGYERAAHLAYVWLPGGDAGVRNPCRMSLSHLHSAGVPWDPRLPPVAACSPAERSVLARQMQTGVRCRPTSSMGRLFDAVSSLAGVCHRVAYEAEAAMRFEGRARDAIEGCERAYAFGRDGAAGPRAIEVAAGPVIRAAAVDVLAGVPAEVVAARFHLAVVNLVADLATDLRERTGLGTVALSGGVFLNALLTRLCVKRLQDRDFRVLSHHLVPPSDAGLALGQLIVAARTTSVGTTVIEVQNPAREQRSAPCA